MDRQDLYDIAFDILCGIFEEEPDREIVEEVISYVEDIDMDEETAICTIKGICSNMFDENPKN